GEQLCEFWSVDAHPGRDQIVGVVDLLVRDFETEALGLGYLQDFVDQAIHHLLARRHLLTAHLQKFGAVLDIKDRDRLTVDKGHHLLRLRAGWQDKHDRAGENGSGEALPVEAERNLRSHFISLLSGPLYFAPMSLAHAICARKRRLSVSSLAPPAVSTCVS